MYPGDARIVRIDRGDEPPRYRFDAPGLWGGGVPLGTAEETRRTTWDEPGLAELYADVWTAVGGFREEKTGDRGIPPEVERDGREATVAYLTTMPGGSTKWAARHYDLDRQRIYEYISRVRARAEEEQDDD